MGITEALLNWYDDNKRDFPFRGVDDPYLIWVSEIMLQQTQTVTVSGYFTRFIRQFPDVFALADAEEQAVLKAWEGLGYYSRARNLRKAARIIVEERQGRLPSTAEDWQRLPGVGPYTAAAIASIAFSEPVPAIDGNLTRVICRLFLVEEDPAVPSVKRRIYALGKELMPLDRPGDMNQALMDLGATICLPGTPDCPRCPLLAFCQAEQAGMAENLPNLSAKKPPKPVSVAVGLIFRGGKVLLVKRRDALLKGLYVFPLIEGEDDAAALGNALEKSGIHVDTLDEVGQARHIFTHRIWHMRLYAGKLKEAPPDTQGIWADAAGVEALPLPGAMRAARQYALEALSYGKRL
ncbi:MAG: A/G-specific adenine glycosylase [Eubacteriales bacterium]|nr:A/G-specific adenine glycosylase [Eubacteriales bacterium]